MTDADPHRRIPFPATIQMGPACPHCRRIIETDVTLDYFREGTATCPHCQAKFDWLAVLTELLVEGEHFHQALGPAGARWTVTQIALEPKTNYHLNLAEHGVPADARVLFMNYSATVQGGLIPLEWHGNTPTRSQDVKRILIPVEFHQPPYSSTKVTILAAWVPANMNTEPWAEFVRALEAHVAADYEAAIVPASAAVEAATWQLIHAIIDPYASQKNLRGFEREARFGDLLNILVPTFAGVLGQPRMSDEMRERVNRLRNLRNEIAHRGRPETAISKRESAALLAAALLSHRYCRLVVADVHGRAHETAER